jgi:hypothetical protein
MVTVPTLLRTWGKPRPLARLAFADAIAVGAHLLIGCKARRTVATYFGIFVTALVLQAIAHSLLNRSPVHVTTTARIIPGASRILVGVFRALKGESRTAGSA